MECKASKTVHLGMTAPLAVLSRAMRDGARCILVHRRARTGAGIRAIAPGVEALDEYQFVEFLNMVSLKSLRK